MDPQIFKSNLRGLLDVKGMSQRELAKKCGIGEEWVRRVCSRGLTREEDRNRDQLNAICKELGVSPVKRLWSPDLLASKGEAAWYGSKVEEILNATRSVKDFSEFVDISEESIVEMVQLIDRLHTALKKSWEKISDQHEASPNQPSDTDASTNVNQLRLATEYSAKLRDLFRTRSISEDTRLWQVAVVVDALYFEKEAHRFVTILRDKEQAIYEEWLVFFGNRQTLENSVAFAFTKYDKDEILNWLACNSPPEHRSDEPLGDWMLIGRGIRSAKKELSTHGGNVADQ